MGSRKLLIRKWRAIEDLNLPGKDQIMVRYFDPPAGQF